MRKSTVLKRLMAGIQIAADEMECDPPVLHGNVIQWDGPFEWAICMTAEQCMWSSEWGGWLEPWKCETKLQEFYREAKEAGFTIECETAHSISVWS